MVSPEHYPDVKRLWILAHFNPRHGLSDHVVLALQQYRQFGGTIVLSSTSALSAEARVKLDGLVDHIFVRENIGLDFSSWKYALDQLGDTTAFDEIITVNDSVVGPVFDLHKAFVKYNSNADPIFGMTISRETGAHIQSYFILFNFRVFPRSLFDQFWGQVTPLKLKFEIIQNYEVGLSRFLVDQGIALKAAYDMTCPPTRGRFKRFLAQLQSWEIWANLTGLKRISDAHFRRLGNPTHYHWDEILAQGVPYIKIELLLDNPQNIPLRPIWKALDGYSPEACRAIKRLVNGID